MTLVLKSEKPSLREDKTGAIRVERSRVLLEMVIHAFQDGASAETIVDNYSTLTLSDLYSTIAYYLKNKDSVEEYLNRREELAKFVKQRLQSVKVDWQYLDLSIEKK